MKRQFSIFAAILLGAALTSCQDTAEKDMVGGGDPIIFTTSIGDYAVKATDTAFEDGDIAGLTILDPINREGVKITWQGGAFVPEETLYWQRGQKESTRFIAWYPYDAQATAMIDPTEEFAFYVDHDQSNPDNYKRADLLGAVTDATPGQNVHLGFRHLLSRFDFRVSSEIDIQGIRIEGLSNMATVDIANGRVAGYASEQLPDAFFPCEVGDWLYSVITVPQVTILRIIFTTADQREIVFNGIERLVFESGKKISASINIKADETITFTADILDWNEGGSADFGQDGQEQGGYEQLFVYYRNGTQVPMTTEDGRYYNATISRAAETDSYVQFLITDESREKIFGGRLNGRINLESWNDCDTDPYRYLLAYVTYGAGTFNVTLDVKDKTIFVTEFEPWGEGSILEGNITALFGFPTTEWPVMYGKSIDNDGVICVYNTFASGPYGQYFNLVDGVTAINIQDPEKVYLMADSTPGIVWNEGTMLSYSLVDENGWSGYDAYSTLTDGEIPLGYRSLVTYVPGEGYYYGNRTGHTVYVLPGSERHTYFVNDLSDLSWSAITASDGSKQLRVTTTMYPDNTLLRLAVFEGSLDEEQAQQALEQARTCDEPFTEYGFDADVRTYIDIPLSETGRYTIFAYTEGADGTFWYWYYHVAYVPDGEEAPECDFEVTCIRNEIAPESEVDFILKGDELYSAFAKAIPLREAEGMTEDQLLEAASKGAQLDWANRDFSGGLPFGIYGLEPSTSYMIAVYGVNAYGGVALRTFVTVTSEDDSWEDLGVGAFYDGLVPGMWVQTDRYDASGDYPIPYASSVMIQKSMTKEGKYRVIDPYGELYSNAEDALVQYIVDAPSRYFDFYIREVGGQKFINYSIINTGFNPFGGSYGAILYWHNALLCENPAENELARQQKQVKAGVFNISPYMQLANYRAYLANYGVTYGAVVVLPGYSFDYTAAWKSSMEGNGIRRKPGVGMPSVTMVGETGGLRPVDVKINVHSACAAHPDTVSGEIINK
ncbi:MAG: fimbrillin family protein [Bacteroidales bacterium]|nr:fimbrillin family protein [Bacteroidales bacterium]